MAKEIERKFLVRDNSFIKMSNSSHIIRQAYLSSRPEATVRVRVADDSAWLTVKGANTGIMRSEWEYRIPVTDAERMADELAGGWAIDKTRYIVDYEGFVWEVDVFAGRLSGLIVAEVELPSVDCHPALPPFVGKEVTGDARYYNSALATAGKVPDCGEGQ